MEYIVDFPSNARQLAREIAAFASTDGGVILLGVDDSGELVGLPAAHTLEGRDVLLRRLEGVCHGPIKPSVTPSAVFAIEEERPVLVIRIPKGEQPIYYCHGKPYVRHLTQSRPAEPHEVIERISQFLTIRSALGVAAEHNNQESSREGAFLTELAMLLRDVFLWADEAEGRRVNPGLRDLMFQFDFGADQLRVLASDDVAEDLGLRQRLADLSDKLDAVAHYQHTLGSESQKVFLGKIEAAHEAARELWDELIQDKELARGAREQALESLRRLARQLNDIADRGEEWVESGRLRDLQAEASSLGRRVVELSYLGLHREEQGWVQEVRLIGHELHLADMISFTLGGMEISQLLDLIRTSADQLQDLTDSD